MSKLARDVELDRLVHGKPLDGGDASPPGCGTLEQLPNVPSYRATAASRIPVLLASKPKAGVVNPNFCNEEQSPLGIEVSALTMGFCHLRGTRGYSSSSCFLLLFLGRI